jgi:hypothetical protein
MVTVSVKKGDRLDIVADAWHMESDCERTAFSPMVQLFSLET